MNGTLLTLALLGLAVAPATGPSPALLEVIEIRNVPNPSDTFDFVFVDAMGGATKQTLDDSDGDSFVTASVPPVPSVSQKFVHNALCQFARITNVDPLPPGTSSAQVPLLIDFATGGTVVPSISLLDLASTPSLAVGTRFTVTSGSSSVLPNATVLDPAMEFDDIPLTLFGDPGVFPPFTGTAEVVALLNVSVIVRCAADVDNDGIVGVVDLLALLAAWGPCPAYCAPDTDVDGEVGVQDLLRLLATWGPCP